MPKCAQRCLGTLLSEPSCVFNLLTHFHGACSTELGVGSPLDPLCYSPAAATLLGPLWTNNALHPPSKCFLILLSFILSSVCLHPSPMASFFNLLCGCRRWECVFSRTMSKDKHNQESRRDEIWGEWRQEVEGQRGVACPRESSGEVFRFISGEDWS